MSKERIIVIGVDGATFSVIDPMIGSGRLPNIARMIAEGVRGNLRSTVPPLSPVAWTSFMTGMNAGKHGIFDFVARHPESYRMVRCSAKDRRAKPVWSILSDNGARVCVFGVTLTYPPDRVNGCMISGLGIPFDLKGATYTSPPELAGEIAEKVGPYSVYFPIPLHKFNDSDKIKDQYLKLVIEAFEYRWRLFEYLWRKESFDFCLPFFLDTDGISHHFWRLTDPRHKLFAPNPRQDVVNLVYAKIDEIVGRILQLAGDDIHVLIVSDHGFGPLNRVVHLNNWLESKGWLKGRRVTPLSKLAGKLTRSAEGYIDWANTRAYFMGTFGNIRVNLQGREPLGIVPAGEYEKLRHEIADAIKDLADPENGAKVIRNVNFREDLYKGGSLDKAADIILEFEPGYDVFGEEIDQNRRHEKSAIVTDCRRWSGTHEPDGVFIARGRHFRRGVALSGAQIIDIAPTVLHLLGQAVPADMDGKVLADIFAEEFARSNAVRTTGPAEPTQINETPAQPDEPENEQMIERLRDLGYIE